MFISASQSSVLCFEIIVGAILLTLLLATKYAYRENPTQARKVTLRVIGGGAIWLGTLAALISSHKMAALPSRGLPFFFGSVFVISVLAALSSYGRKLSVEIPLLALVGFQAFRLPLELVLHQWALSRTIPETMTWTGQNWDVVSGALAFIIWPLVGRYRTMAWGFNLIGFGLLLNVMRVALLSSPVPFGWNVQPPLELAFHLPYAFIGPVCVGGALFGHIVLTRALLRKTSTFAQ